ncbi:MAG: EMC3/TMCO1 family protein [Candidatus Bathyarchaeota archaeon]|nr:EMC3/TMCO1 family protein [Candidatus Bathyarchaeota archaeon]
MKKIVALLVFAMVMLSAVALAIGPVTGQGALSFQASIIGQSAGVSEATTYTVTISNNGQANLGDAKLSIPAGYTNVKNVVITQQPASQNWNITIQNDAILMVGSGDGLPPGQQLVFTFEALNPQVAGSYSWTLGGNQTTSSAGLNSPEYTTNITSNLEITSMTAAIIVLFIAAGIAALNTVINRLLIGYFVGWEQYRVMQKEMAEYRTETMAAARANDKKQMEKLKKRQSQINAMQQKMLKPQMVQFGISFLYLFVWFLVLTPTFGSTSMAYIPGFGPVPVFYWYPICSLFLGLLAQRLIGVMPIEQR